MNPSLSFASSNSLQVSWCLSINNYKINATGPCFIKSTVKISEDPWGGPYLPSKVHVNSGELILLELYSFFFSYLNVSWTKRNKITKLRVESNYQLPAKNEPQKPMETHYEAKICKEAENKASKVSSLAPKTWFSEFLNVRAFNL